MDQTLRIRQERTFCLVKLQILNHILQTIAVFIGGFGAAPGDRDGVDGGEDVTIRPVLVAVNVVKVDFLIVVMWAHGILHNVPDFERLVRNAAPLVVRLASGLKKDSSIWIVIKAKSN